MITDLASETDLTDIPNGLYEVDRTTEYDVTIKERSTNTRYSIKKVTLPPCDQTKIVPDGIVIMLDGEISF